MKTGERWSSWNVRAVCWLLAPALLAHAPGCAKDRAAVGRNLMAQPPAVSPEAVLAEYRASCPDVLEINIAGRPEFAGRHEIGADGRIDLHDYGRVRVE